MVPPLLHVPGRNTFSGSLRVVDWLECLVMKAVLGLFSRLGHWIGIRNSTLEILISFHTLLYEIPSRLERGSKRDG